MEYVTKYVVMQSYLGLQGTVAHIDRLVQERRNSSALAIRVASFLH